MPAIDDEIDRLYQLPLRAFTAAREALARRAGARSPEVRSLQKPTLPAWAVNQLYWQRRRALDRLVTASGRMRAAHAGRLAGKGADVTDAEAAHRVALNRALEEVRTLLAQHGEEASAATLRAVEDTLHTLLWTGLDGRLTRPLRPTGLEALAELGNQGESRRPSGPAEVIPIRRGAGGPEGDGRREAAAARRRDAAEVERQLRASRVAEREAESDLTRVRKDLDRADKDRRRLEAELEQASERLRQLRRDVDQQRKRAEETAAERSRLEQRLAWLRAE